MTMRRLGLIGGVSPEATVIYYRLLNEAARARFGGEHSAELMVYTLNYGVMIEHYHNEDWPSFIEEVASAARQLAAAGADAIVISSNTTHIGADAAAAASGLPVIHMLDVLAEAMHARQITQPLLFGTPMVMGGAYYRPALSARFDGDVLVPDADEQALIGRVILDELVHGVIEDTSRMDLLSIIDRWRGKGADGIILGCTELCMILDQAHTDLPVFDTTGLHAAAAARFAFGAD